MIYLDPLTLYTPERNKLTNSQPWPTEGTLRLNPPVEWPRNIQLLFPSFWLASVEHKADCDAPSLFSRSTASPQIQTLASNTWVHFLWLIKVLGERNAEIYTNKNTDLQFETTTVWHTYTRSQQYMCVHMQIVNMDIQVYEWASSPKN